MQTNRVVFSFFRYPALHAFGAFVLMGFQGLFRGRDMPEGRIRLMGCGGQDGFSILPDFKRYCLVSALHDPREQVRLKGSRLYRYVAKPSIEQLHFVLKPTSGHGIWDGEDLFDYSHASIGDRPFVVLTWAKVRPACARSFWSAVPGVRQHLRNTPGCLYHIGFGEHPLLTLATFSVWKDLEAMRGFAYRQTPHHSVSRAARAEQWLSESLFARFEIEALHGDLDAYPRLRALLLPDSAHDGQ